MFQILNEHQSLMKEQLSDYDLIALIEEKRVKRLISLYHVRDISLSVLESIRK